MQADRSSLQRREFLEVVGGAFAMSVLPGGAPRANPPSRGIKAVAFDGFAIFDPTPVLGQAELTIPGRGRELVMSWRSRQFEYQWLRTLGGRYADFRQTAADALTVSAKVLGVSMTGDQRERLLESYLTLVPWPDAVGAIRALRTAGLRLAFLSNMTESMLDDGARRAGVRDAFEIILSTDRVRAAKPDARAYRMALDSLRLSREEVAFVAFAGWDAAGAEWFGYPTVWTNRLSTPAEELGTTSIVIARDLTDVVAFANRTT